MRLSVILPVYNVERYLPMCLESVVQQCLGDYEVILVDDGSTDESGAICDDYAERYEKFSVIHQENQGLSAARNRGIAEAKGEYVVFLDSDDFWVQGTIKPLLQQAYEHDLEVLGFKYIEVPEKAQEAQPINYEPQPLEVLNGIDFVTKHNFVAVSVAYLVKRNHLIDNNITFPVGHMIEDAGFSMRVYLNAKRVAQTDCVAYCYRYRPTSIINNKNETHQRKILDDFIYAAYDINTIINKKRSELTPECYERCRTRRDSYVLFGAIRALKLGKVKDYIAKAKAQKLYPFKSLSETDYPGFKFKLLHWCANKPWLWRALSSVYRLFKR